MVPTSPSERQRLEVLAGYGILDTTPEPAFDDLTSLALEICAADAALFVLADAHGLRTKSAAGALQGELGSHGELRSFLLQQQDVFVCQEQFLKEAFRPGAHRACAGVPVVSAEGFTLGALLLLAPQPIRLAPRQVSALRVIGRQFTAQLELRRVRRAWDQERRENAERTRELLHERNLSETIINSAPGVFYLFDTSGRFLRWNENFEKISGYSHEEFAKLHPLDLFRGSDKDLIAERIAETFTAGVSDAEAPMVTKDGRSIDYYFTGRLVEVDGQPGLIGMGIDVTARKQLEERLREIQRTESIGQLAAGLAHDFNNILTVIQGQTGRLLGLPEVSPKGREALEQIGLAADRAARLTGQLLMMTRQQVMQMTTLDVNEVLSRLVPLLERLVGEAIELDLQMARALPSVRADLGMLEQVLMNLVINARDATPSGGCIQVRTALVHVGTDYVAQHPGSHIGDFVCLAVADSGTGISSQVLPRIFEPFFTTKDVGKGTGLGLATVYSILKQHQGFVDVHTELGKGTTFRLYFPNTTLPAAPMATHETSSQVRYGGSETILVVEDEATVAMMLEAVLQEHGYRTLTACDGRRALEVWQTHAGKINLLVTDLVMPRGVSGRELTHRLWSDAPELPVIYVSGYTAESIRSDLLEHSRLRYLQKPYRPEALVALARELLDAL
ncbi:MAG: ATP-binding protein [Myxococcales bacterium]